MFQLSHIASELLSQWKLMYLILIYYKPKILIICNCYAAIICHLLYWCPRNRFFTRQTFLCTTQRFHTWISDALLPYLQPRKQTFLGLNQLLNNWKVSPFRSSVRLQKINYSLIFLCLWKSLSIKKHDMLQKPWKHHSSNWRL